MGAGFRHVRACGRKQNKVRGGSVSVPGKPWSGVPLLNVPILITNDVVLTTPTNASATTSLVLSNLTLITQEAPNNPMDCSPSPSNHSITLFRADLGTPNHEAFAVQLGRPEEGEEGDGSEPPQGRNGWGSDEHGGGPKAQPISGTEIGHSRHLTIGLDLTEGRWRLWACRHADLSDVVFSVETGQVASKRSWRAPGASSEFNATEYLTNQFNPFVAENIPPMILDFGGRGPKPLK
jgi:hypothetical protein